MNLSLAIIPLSSLRVLSHFGFRQRTISDTPLLVTLDTGNPLTSLPSNITDDTFAMLGATYDEQHQVATINCSAENRRDAFLYFVFGSVTITMPINELVLPVRPISGSDECLFGINTANENPRLGETFLRGAYVVYDLQNEQISIAEPNFLKTPDNITAIGPNGVGRSISGVGPTRVLPHSSSTSTTAPVLTSTSLDSTSSTPHHVLSTGSKAAIGVGVPMAVLALAALAVVLARRARNIARSHPPRTDTDSSYALSERDKNAPELERSASTETFGPPLLPAEMHNPVSPPE